MGAIFATLAIPPGLGVGAATDVHLWQPNKSIVVGGTLDPATGETVIVEGSIDPAASAASFFGVAGFLAANEPPRAVFGVVYWLRVRRVQASPLNVPNIEVGSDTDATQTYFTLPVPASGAGAAVDVSAGGAVVSVCVQGGIVTTGQVPQANGETFLVEGSNDNIAWTGVAGFQSDNAGPATFLRRYNFLRVRRPVNLGSSPGCFVGTSTEGAAAGTVNNILGADGIIVQNGAGPVATVRQSLLGATWPTGIARIYTVDIARPDNSGAGFADPSSSSAADYRAASVAAGAIAKKTIAGLAAIFPRVGNGRTVEIQIAAGAYNGDDLSALLNGCTGYVGGITVRGTGTVASAGTTKFDGTAADTATVGGVTGTGLFAAGYNTTFAANTQTMSLTQVGGGATAFAFPNGLPLGIRARFDIGTTTGADANQARQVAKVISASQITLQTGVSVQPVLTDTLYLEQPGVRLTGSLNLTAPGTDGLTLVGLAWAGSLNVDPAAGRHRFVFCTFDDAGTETLQSASGVVVAQSYTHPVYGTTTPGGGLLCQGNVTVTGPRLSLEGLVSKLALTVVATDSTWVLGAGCVARNWIVNSSWASDSDDSGEQPNIGLNDSTAGDGGPSTFGAGANGALQINASALRIGRCRFNTFNGKAAIYLTGKCNIGFVGAGNADSDGSGNVGLSLADSTDSEIRIGSTAPTSVTGTQGDIAWSGPIYNAWAVIGGQDGHDASGNHIYYAFSNGAQYQHRPPPSVFRSTFSIGGGAVPRYGLLRVSPGTNFCIAASNLNVNDVQGLAGTSETDNPADVTRIYIRPPGAATMVAFDANVTLGKTAYLSGTAGLATQTPPTSGPIIPIGVAVSGAGTEAVVQWFPAGGGPATAANWTVGLTRVYTVDFVNGDNKNLGYATPVTSSAADYATACAAAGAVAKKTFAGLAAIFPRVGAGRNVEVVIANGGVNTEQAYGVGIDTFLAGTGGYNSFDIRGTGTNVTANCNAFDGSTADVTYQGGITATGLNAPGYNPNGATSTSLPCLQVGGGAPALPAEPAAPLGWRVRFDAATATPGLRNQCRQIAQVTGGTTIVPLTAFSSAPANGDVFYIEQPGVAVTNSELSFVAGGNGSQTSPSNLNVCGIRDTGTMRAVNSTLRLIFSGCATFIANGHTQVITSQSLTHPVLGTVVVGGGLRSEGSGAFTTSFICNLQAFVCATSLATSFVFQHLWAVGCYVGTTFTVQGCSFPTGNDANINPQIGSSTAQGSPRMANLALTGFTGQVGGCTIAGAGATPAIKVNGACRLSFSQGVCAGSAGNTDVGLDLTNAQGSEIVIVTTPTVTGTAGDVRLAGGQIISWAQALHGITDQAGNVIVANLGSVTGLGIADRLKGVALADVGLNGEFTIDPFVGQNIGDQWATNGGVGISSTLLTAVECPGAVNDVIFRREFTLDLRTNDWFIGGSMQFDGAMQALDVKGFALDDGGAFANGAFLGVNQIVSGGFFSFAAVVAGLVTASGISTVPYDNAIHFFYAKGNKTRVVFSVDFETPIVVTANILNLPTGINLYQVFGCRGGAMANPFRAGDFAYAHNQ